MSDFFARPVMRYHTSSWTPRWSKRGRVYRWILDWAFDVRRKIVIQEQTKWKL